MRAQIRLVLALAATLVPLADASAQDFPNRPVRFVVPYAAGGSGDILVRLLGPKLTNIWGQQLVVDNKPGAGAVIGTEFAARQEPDGYTIYLATDGPTVVAASLNKSLPYYWKRDFVPVTMLAVSYQVMLVNKADPARNLQEFVENARRQPGKFNYGSIGPGSSPHLAAEMVKAAANIDLVHVPYRGSSAQAMTAMLQGEIAMMMNGVASSLPHIQNGNLRGLAVTGPRREAGLPDVPTFAEVGYPSVEVILWFAAMVPARTPPAIVKKLHADLVQASADPEYKKALEARGLEVQNGTPEQLAAHMERDEVKFRALLQKLGMIGVQ